MLVALLIVPSLTLLSLCLYLSSSVSVAALLLLLSLALCFVLFRLPPSPSMLHWSGSVMGHRGCRTNLNVPENSLLAFAYAVEHGAHAIELDCSLSADGVIVCMHDGSVERTCEGSGEVGELSFAAINALRFRSTGKRMAEHEPVGEPEMDKRRRWNAPSTTRSSGAAAATDGQGGMEDEEEGCGEEWAPTLPYPSSLLPERLCGPPSLEQVVRFVQHHGLRVMIEVKEYRRPHLLFQRLLELYDAYPYLWRHSYVATFNPWHIYCLRSLQPTLPTCLLYCRGCLEWYHTDGSREMQLPAPLNHRPVRWLLDELLLHSIPLVATFLRPACLGPHDVLLSIEQCEMFRRQGVMMYVWCVNRRCELQLWSEEGAVVGTDFVFPLRDVKGEGKEVREGRMEWTLQDERRWQEEIKEQHMQLHTQPVAEQQQGMQGIGADGKARSALIVDA